MRIDAHQHFWNLARDDYFWMTDQMAAIRRNFRPDDLLPHLKAAGFDKTVLVQAAPTVEETEYLLGIADAHPVVGKVVGWINFEDETHRHHLERWARHEKFAGVRPMVQDIPDPEWVHRPDVQWGFDAVVDLGLTLDALGFPVHAAPFLRLFEKYPSMKAVVDHCMKPQIADDAFDDWSVAMSRIADETGAYCKLSGLITESGSNWNAEKLRPYAEHILSAFGADRVMFGSDWPVLNLASDYPTWYEIATSFVPEVDREKVFGGTAARFYGIEA